MLIAIIPIQRVDADSPQSAQSGDNTFTLILKGVKSYQFEGEAEQNIGDSTQVDTEISNVKFGKKITLISKLESNQQHLWSSTSGDKSNALQVFEKESLEEADKKLINKTRSNKIVFIVKESDVSNKRLRITVEGLEQKIVFKGYPNDAQHSFNNKNPLDLKALLTLSHNGFLIDALKDNLVDLKWSSENQDVAEVNDGIVTPIKNGTTTIKVEGRYQVADQQADDPFANNSILKGELKVKVNLPVVVGLKVLKDATAKITHRAGKPLNKPIEVSQGYQELHKDDILEVTALDSTNFDKWKFNPNSLEIEGNDTEKSNPIHFKVNGKEDVGIIAQKKVSALTFDGNILGKVGEALSNKNAENEVRIALVSQDSSNPVKFKNVEKGTDVRYWFKTKVDGLRYAVQEFLNENTEIVIMVSGVPNAPSDEILEIEIPKEALENYNKSIAVERNEGLKYKITQKQVVPQPKPPVSNDSSSDDSSDSGSSGSGISSSVTKITKKSKDDPNFGKKEKEPKLQNDKTQDAELSNSNKENTKSDLIEQVIKIDGVEIEKVFNDVNQIDWYAKSVAFVKEKNLMSGTQEKMFSPAKNASRAMLVTILYRMANMPEAEPTSEFNDVKGDEYFAKAISWASKNEIVKGYADGRFGVSDDITREQLATVLYQYSKSLKIDIDNTTDITLFDDSQSISAYAVDAMRWANSIGLIKGRGRVLDPTGKATRAEVAAVIMRFYNTFFKSL